MSVLPSIKGSVLAGHAEVLNKYLSSHPIDPAVLARRFPDGELELLARPLSTVGWYDLRIYQRVLEFLRDYAGKGRNEYLLDAGARSAEALIRAGFYQQMEYLRRTQLSAHEDPAERFQAFGRDLRLLGSLTSTIMNFVTTSVKPDPEHPDRWMLVYECTAPFPEVLCWTTQGFCNRMAEEHGTPELWRWTQPRPDLVQLRMQYSVRERESPFAFAGPRRRVFSRPRSSAPAPARRAAPRVRRSARAEPR
jgi:hypothetical protein